jgi:hypothetical protein
LRQLVVSPNDGGCWNVSPRTPALTIAFTRDVDHDELRPAGIGFLWTQYVEGLIHETMSYLPGVDGMITALEQKVYLSAKAAEDEAAGFSGGNLVWSEERGEGRQGGPRGSVWVQRRGLGWGRGSAGSSSWNQG